MEHIEKIEKDVAGLEKKHYQTGEGSLDEYIDKETGNIVKIIMKEADGRTTILNCNPSTGKLEEREEYDSEGNMVRWQDEKSIQKASNKDLFESSSDTKLIKEAVVKDGLWYSRMLEEIQIQGGDVEKAFSVINQMLDEEMLVLDEKQ